jgi:recombination protein RecR
VTPLAPPIEQAIVELCKLPGIGRKSAQRLVFHLLKAPAGSVEALSRALDGLRERVRLCTRCFNLADQELCPICADPRRDATLVCVVEDAANVMTLERSGVFKGLYHVLGGSLSPLKDVGPDELRIRELVDRVRAGGFREAILATNPDVEGEATAVYLARLLKPLGLQVTRLAQGIPAGGDLEFTDDLTLQRAIEGRRDY